MSLPLALLPTQRLQRRQSRSLLDQRIDRFELPRLCGIAVIADRAVDDIDPVVRNAAFRRCVTGSMQERGTRKDGLGARRLQLVRQLRHGVGCIGGRGDAGQTVDSPVEREGINLGQPNQ